METYKAPELSWSMHPCLFLLPSHLIEYPVLDTSCAFVNYLTDDIRGTEWDSTLAEDIYDSCAALFKALLYRIISTILPFSIMPPLFHEMSSSKRLHDQPLTMILVGLGKRASNKILPAICQLDDQVTLVGACDVNESAISAFKTMHPIAHSAPSLQQLLDQFDSASKPECAYVAVTPQSLSQILPTLLENGIHVINEKPAATSAEELEAFHSSAQHYKTLMMTASQTRYGERMYQTKQHLMSIGRICQVDLTRTICVQDLGAGWRASRIAAGGGVLMDLGWHAVDNLVELNLIDESSQVLQIEPLITRPNHMYDCEDTLYFTLLTTRPNTNNIVESTMVSVTLSRAADSKSNKVIFKGTKGILTVDDESATVHLYDSSKSTVTSFTTTSDDDVAAMIHSMLFNMRQGAVSSTYKRYLQQDMRVTRSIENLYARAGICPPLLQWPVITAATQSAVVKQLHTTLSIYSKGGVIADLETEWKKIHKSWDWFSLLHSSGTNALHGLFAGARLTRGDELRDIVAS
jgi:predicted dehydrogenase